MRELISKEICGNCKYCHSLFGYCAGRCEIKDKIVCHNETCEKFEESSTKQQGDDIR